MKTISESARYAWVTILVGFLVVWPSWPVAVALVAALALHGYLTFLFYERVQVDTKRLDELELTVSRLSLALGTRGIVA